jgi:hypothetical protein
MSIDSHTSKICTSHLRTKKENVNKKIIRFFKKYLKTSLKNKTINFTSLVNETKLNSFWMEFIHENIFPPCERMFKGETVQFRSFNEKYINYIFSHSRGVELYNKMLSTQRVELINAVKKSINSASMDKDTEEFIEEYINSFPFTFEGKDFTYNHELNNSQELFQSQQGSECDIIANSNQQVASVRHISSIPKIASVNDMIENDSSTTNILNEMVEMRKEYIIDYINEGKSKIETEEVVITMK